MVRLSKCFCDEECQDSERLRCNLVVDCGLVLERNASVSLRAGVLGFATLAVARRTKHGSIFQVPP